MGGEGEGERERGGGGREGLESVGEGGGCGEANWRNSVPRPHLLGISRQRKEAEMMMNHLDQSHSSLGRTFSASLSRMVGGGGGDGWEGGWGRIRGVRGERFKVNFALTIDWKNRNK